MPKIDSAKERISPKEVTRESTHSSDENEVLDDVANDFFSSRIDLAREGGDSAYASLLREQERVISDLALNPDDAPFGDNEKRLYAGAMAEALSVFTSFDREETDEIPRAVSDAEALFRELGKELFGPARAVDVGIASTKLDQVKKKFDRVSTDSSFGPMQALLDQELVSLQAEGGASEMLKTDPSKFNERLQRLQAVLADTLAGSMSTIEEMRTSNELSVIEANHKSGEALKLVEALFQLQSLIDAVKVHTGAVESRKNDELKIDSARERAQTVAERMDTASTHEDESDLSMKELSEKLNDPSLVSVEDFQRVFGDQERRSVLKEVLDYLRLKAEAGKRIDPTGVTAVEAKVPNNVLGPSATSKRVFQVPAIVAEGRVVSPEEVNKVTITEYLQRFLGYDLKKEADPELLTMLQKHTNLFD